MVTSGEVFDTAEVTHFDRHSIIVLPHHQYLRNIIFFDCLKLLRSTVNEMDTYLASAQNNIIGDLDTCSHGEGKQAEVGNTQHKQGAKQTELLVSACWPSASANAIQAYKEEGLQISCISLGEYE